MEGGGTLYLKCLSPSFYKFMKTPLTGREKSFSGGGVTFQEKNTIGFDKISSHPMNVRQGKSFQWCTHFLYCSVLSLGSNINTRVGVSQPDMGSIFQIKNQ